MTRLGRRWIACLAAAIVLGFGSAAWLQLPAREPSAPADTPMLVLRAAESLSLPQTTLGPPSSAGANLGRSGWRVVALPDDWARTRPGHEGAVWYRIEFQPPPVPAGELLALLIPRSCQNAEVWLNGSRLERDGRITLPYTRNCYQSQLVTLPTGLLAARENLLEIQLVGHPLNRVAARQRAAGMSELVIGPQSLLRPAHARQLFWSLTAIQIMAVLLALIGIVMASVGWVRSTAELQLFGCTALGWSILSARIWWRELPLPNALVEALVCLGFVPVSVCCMLFLLRHAGRPRSRRELLLWGQCLLAPLVLWLAGPGHLFVVASAIYAVLATELLATVALYLWTVWRDSQSDRWLMSAMLALVLLTVAAEVAVQAQLLPLPQMHLIHFAMPFLFCALAFRLAQVYVGTLRHAEQSRAGLGHQIEAMRHEMELSYSLLSEQRAEQTAESERKRIAADLHDDLGAKLLTIVHTSADDHIATLAREALEEMRLSVRGLTGRPLPLADALADWRAETVSRLGEAGIGVEWSSDELPAPRMLSARSFVQTTRILREAVSNMIKHSGASQCHVRCAVDADLQLVIGDNGRGVPMQLDGKLDRGHGMYSMKHRAKQLHGQCLVESGPGYGTVIRLTIPL
ncbi:MAG: hypothetical protein RLZZ598_1813 [Pseudomonadota bacterium]